MKRSRKSSVGSSPKVSKKKSKCDIPVTPVSTEIKITPSNSNRTSGGISKSLLTPCRRLGLTKNRGKTLNVLNTEKCSPNTSVHKATTEDEKCDKQIFSNKNDDVAKEADRDICKEDDTPRRKISRKTSKREDKKDCFMKDVSVPQTVEIFNREILSQSSVASTDTECFSENINDITNVTPKKNKNVQKKELFEVVKVTSEDRSNKKLPRVIIHKIKSKHANDEWEVELHSEPSSIIKENKENLDCESGVSVNGKIVQDTIVKCEDIGVNKLSSKSKTKLSVKQKSETNLTSEHKKKSSTQDNVSVTGEVERNCRSLGSSQSDAVWDDNGKEKICKDGVDKKINEINTCIEGMDKQKNEIIGSENGIDKKKNEINGSSKNGVDKKKSEINYSEDAVHKNKNGKDESKNGIDKKKSKDKSKNDVKEKQSDTEDNILKTKSKNKLELDAKKIKSEPCLKKPEKYQSDEVISLLSNTSSQSSMYSYNSDDDFEDKTILEKKTYDKKNKLQLSRSKEALSKIITQRDLDEIQERIQNKQERLKMIDQSPRKGVSEAELEELITAWRGGCQRALEELLDVAKAKGTMKGDADMEDLLRALNIPHHLVRYDPDQMIFEQSD